MVYAEKMERIVSQRPKRKADWARKVPCWIVCTQKLLSLKELQHALRVEAGETIYDPEEEVLETGIISTTAGPVTIDFDHREDKCAVRIHVPLTFIFKSIAHNGSTIQTWTLPERS